MPSVQCPDNLRLKCNSLNSGESGISIDDLAGQLSPFLNGLDNICVVADIKPQGVGGGGITAGSWVTRDLNTFITGASNVAGVLANQVELLDTPYLVLAQCPAGAVDQSQARLQNITDNVTFGQGVAGIAATAPIGLLYVNWTIGRVVPTQPNTKIELQHQVLTTNVGAGGGIAGFGNAELYSFMILFKLSK